MFSAFLLELFALFQRQERGFQGTGRGKAKDFYERIVEMFIGQDQVNGGLGGKMKIQGLPNPAVP